MTRQMVWSYETLYEDSAEEFLRRLQSKIASIKQVHPEATDFRVEQKSAGYYSDDKDIFVSYKRLEDDREYARRAHQEEVSRKQREDYDRQEYERLKKKFETPS